MHNQEMAWDTLQALKNDIIGLHAFFLAVIRFAIGKYGGTMRTDPISGETQLQIPDWAEEACFEDLGQLLGPGKALNAYLPLLEL